MAATIERTIRLSTFRDRLEVKAFKSSDDMHRFLNKGANGNLWRVHVGGLKPGLYAHAGGKWHNVKSLDAMSLAHI